jgi:CheY-like chemotaxis protein
VVDDFTLISYGKKNFAEFDADVVVQESLHTKCVREGFALFGLPVYGIDEHPKKNERISCIVLDWEQIKAEGVQGDAMVERLLTSYGRGIFVVLSSVLASDVEIEKMLANVRLRIVKKPVCLWKILSTIARIATDEDIAGGGFEQTMQSGNGRILLCDDHVINREMVKELLVQVGYAVDTTETGRQTIQKLEQHQYDLLLLDLQMNDMDGFEVARTIRTKLCNSMPIVAFTAHALPHYEKRSRQAGMNGYLVKPVTPEQLYKEVETWVSFSHRTDTDGLHASMDSLYHEVENLFAIDFSVAMERYLHNLETYRRHLDLLMKDVRNIIDEASSTTVSTKSWKHSLHAMRGVAGNLGLLGFATRLAKHEKKLGDNMTSNSQFSQEDFLPILFEEHSKLVEMSSFLSEFPYDNSKPPKHVQSTARNLDFITMCGNLMEALSLGDFEDAYTLVGAMKASTAERETKIILEAVMEHIKNYDFTLAEKELDCICTHSFSPKERRS